MTPREAFEKCKNKNYKVSELEKIIITDSYYSYLYARNIIYEKFEKGEKNITTDSYTSYCNILHPIIFNSEYKDEFIDFLKSINYDLNEISEWLI